MSCPATSSITTNWDLFAPRRAKPRSWGCRSILEYNQSYCGPRAGYWAAIQCANNHQHKTVAADPLARAKAHVADTEECGGEDAQSGALPPGPASYFCPNRWVSNSTSSLMSVTGDEITYPPLAHCQVDQRQRSLQKREIGGFGHPPASCKSGTSV